MKDLKLIVTDIDGTLLLNGQKHLSEQFLQQVIKFQKKGVLFMAASGRQYQNLQALFYPVQDDIVYLCENGCIGFYKNQIIYQKEFDREVALSISQEILNQENCELQISTPTTQFILPKTKKFYDYMKKETGIHIKKIQSLSAIKEPIIKVASYNPYSTAYREYLFKKFGKKCSMQIGCDEWTDFTPKNTNKGTAFKNMIKTLHISSKNCIAFGDYYNDESLLKAVCYPVVMSSAPQDLQKIGKYTTDTVEAFLENILNF